MRRLTTILVAIAGLALPVGLALAVYLSSASTIAATPVSLPASALGKADPKALSQTAAPRHKKRHHHASGTATGGTVTGADDHGG